MKINFKSVEPVWKDLECGIKVKIRPYPNSASDYRIDISTGKLDITTGKLGWDRFNYCLVDWQELLDENDKPVECNEETKKFIFDYVGDITEEVTIAVRDLISGIMSDVKN